MALASDAPPLSTFRLLSFDIFGTLIDENAGVYKALQPLRSRLPASHPAASSSISQVHDIFDRLEISIHKDMPSLPQHQVLARIYKAIAAEWGIDIVQGEAESFAQSMSEWEPFPDTIAAIQKLSKHYKLVPLSNCDRGTFARVLSGPFREVKFDAVYLAEDIGSYKPDHRNFEYLLKYVREDFGVAKEEVLMVAHGLSSDHVPTKELGIESAWIRRETSEAEERVFEGRVAYKWRWDTLGDFAKDVESELGKR